MRKLFLPLVLLSFFSNYVNAQAFQWAKQFAARYSVGTDVVTDNSYNVISAGWYTDSVDLDPGPGTHWVNNGAVNSSNTSYLCKLNQNGSFVWGYSYQSFANNNLNRIYSIDVDNQDNIVVMGQFRDSIDLDFGAGVFKLYDLNTNTNSAYDNIFIAKYDPSGNLIWGKGLYSSSMVSTYGLWGHGLKVDGSNNVLITGRFRDTVDFDPGPGVYNLVSINPTTSAYYGNKFLLKLTPNGSFIWVRDWDHSGNWNNSNGWWGGNELDVDGNDNIFFPIIYTDSIDVDPQTPVDMVYSNGLRDVSLLKISPSGTLVWHKEIGGPHHDYCHSLATDPSGNIFYSIQLQGTTPVDMDPGPGIFMVSWVNNNWGKVILKLDNSGNFIWALKNLDNNWGGWYGEGIATDTAGGLYLTTRIHSSWNSNSFDLNPGPNAYIVSSNGNYDIAFQNLDGNGNFIWGGVMGGPSYDHSTDICTDNARGVYLTGHFQQQADFDPTPDTSYLTFTPTTYDAFVVKLNNCNISKSTVYQACDSVIYNSQVFYQDTVMQAHYPAWNGCDSAHAIVIDVKTLTNDTIVVDTCKYYVWNSTTYTTSGIYTHNFGLPNGCDSIVTLMLTMHNGSIQNVSLSDCDSASFSGIFYSQTGQYLQQYNNAYGCDSNYLINFTKTTADTSITVTGPQSLVANAVGATYQWIDCATMLPIAGEINVFFNAPQTGSYACIVTQNGCTDTSGCYNMEVWPNAVQDYNLLSKVYPNPSKGSYHLELDKEYKNVQLEIRSMSGQLVWRKDYKKLKETNIKIENASGVYMLYIKQGERTQVKKLLKW